MPYYFLLWGAGLALGATVAWLLLLRLDVPRVRGAVVIAVAATAFAWGARLQARLEWFPVRTAVFFQPGDVFEAGHHLPLGVAAGGSAGAVAALALGLPWAPVADALAIGATVMMGAGRAGCLVNGCCRGIECRGAWRVLCVRYASDGRPSFLSRAPVMTPPVYPLPLYFAAGSALMLAVFVLLRRRSAPPGVVAATFGVMYPLIQLLLEYLRGGTGGEPPLLTVVVLMAIAGGTLASVVVRRWWLWAFSSPAQETMS